MLEDTFGPRYNFERGDESTLLSTASVRNACDTKLVLIDIVYLLIIRNKSVCIPKTETIEKCLRETKRKCNLGRETKSSQFKSK